MSQFSKVETSPELTPYYSTSIQGYALRVISICLICLRSTYLTTNYIKMCFKMVSGRLHKLAFLQFLQFFKNPPGGKKINLEAPKCKAGV